MSKSYIKLYTNFFEDERIMSLSEKNQVRFIKLLLVAAKVEQNGLLPSVYDICWYLHMIGGNRLRDMRRTLNKIHQAGLIKPNGENGWVITYAHTVHRGREITRQWLKMRRFVMKRDQYICSYCGGKAKHVDHIVPLSRGGSNEEDNLVASCQPCNNKKYYYTPEELGWSMLFDPRIKQ